MSLKRFLWLVVVLLLSSMVIYAQTETDLDAVLDAYVGDSDPAVVLLVESPDLGTWVGVRGLADIEGGVHAQTIDRFRIGSITKTFVATIILQLADEGMLTLDDPMSQWLDADLVSNIPYGDEITLRQLMNMTSGIYNYTDTDGFAEAAELDPSYVWTAADTIPYVFDQEPYFPPGEGYYYSNSNYTILQVILEYATNSTLADELQTRIFQPLGMSESFLESGEDVPQGIIRGYSDMGEGLVDVTDINDGVGLGDGGIISTAADLALFPRALLGGELVSDAMLNEMLTLVDDGEGGLYGLGITYYESQWGALYGHTGSISGFQSQLWYLPDYDFTVVVLTNNFDTEILSSIVDDAMYAALGEP